MAVAKIKRKFPTSTVIALIVCGIVIAILAIYVLGFGSLLLGFGSWLLFDVFIAGLMWLAIPQVAVALGLVGVVAFLIYYRRHYGAKKVLVTPTMGATGGVDSLSKPLFDEDMKVESA